MMPLLKKLNFKNQPAIVILNHPKEFAPQLVEIKREVTVLSSLSGSEDFAFILVFAPLIKDLESWIPRALDRIAPDGVLWFAYPKKASKTYQSDIHRDHDCWRLLGDRGYEGVRQVAIDEDWSALRFREVSYIQSMTRDPKRSMTAAGREKIKR